MLTFVLDNMLENWLALLGMDSLGKKKKFWSVFIERYIFFSQEITKIFK